MVTGHSIWNPQNLNDQFQRTRIGRIHHKPIPFVGANSPFWGVCHYKPQPPKSKDYHKMNSIWFPSYLLVTKIASKKEWCSIKRHETHGPVSTCPIAIRARLSAASGATPKKEFFCSVGSAGFCNKSGLGLTFPPWQGGGHDKNNTPFRTNTL